MSDNQSEKNKELVARLYKEIVFPQKPNLDFLDRAVHEDYKRHGLTLAEQGRAALRDFLVNVYPAMRATADPADPLDHTLIADGDLVVSRMTWKTGMLIDIFRIEDGLIVEHWDAYRPAPGTERLQGF